MHSQVIADLDHVDIPANLTQEVPHQGLAQLSNPRQQGAREIGIFANVKHELIHALHGIGALEREGKPGRCENGVFIFVHQLLCFGFYVGDASRVVHVGPGIGFDVFDRMRLRQGVDRWEPRARVAFHRAHAPRIEIGRARLSRPVLLTNGSRFPIVDAAHVTVEAFEYFFIDGGSA